MSSQADKLERTAHKTLPLGQPEIGGSVCLASKTEQEATAGAKPRRGKNSAYGGCEHTDGATVDTGVGETEVVCMTLRME